MKRIIPVYIFQQVNVLLVSLYLLKFLCIGELTILQILYGASLISFLWMYGFFSSVAHSFERIVDGSWMTAKFRSYFSQISIWIVSKIVFKSISINFSWFCSFYLVV
ncbi:putative metal-dependent membrane protease [Streptococcus pneumoniae]|nr:putative metal-dependent membrane protease [Streptococcus pneumoniae]